MWTFEYAHRPDVASKFRRHRIRIKILTSPDRSIEKSSSSDCLAGNRSLLSDREFDAAYRSTTQIKCSFFDRTSHQIFDVGGSIDRKIVELRLLQGKSILTVRSRPDDRSTPCLNVRFWTGRHIKSSTSTSTDRSIDDLN